MSPTPDLPTRARVVIVGGGVIGTSIAYHLTKLGWGDVVLLERDRLTSGTTWHAAGLITSAGMVDETALFMARYSRDLYERLEEETGLSTGFRAVGHISIATNEHRMEALRREALFVNGFGVEDQELSPAEIADLWPMLRTDDLVGGPVRRRRGSGRPGGGGHEPGPGRPHRGCRHRRGVPGHRGHDGPAPGDRGRDRARHHRVRVRRQRGRHVGPPVRARWPASTRCNQAAEHYYLITEPMEGVHRDLPVVEDPDCYGYFRPEGDGLLVGLFEPDARAWQLDGVPDGSSFLELPPTTSDWPRSSTSPWPGSPRWPTPASASSSAVPSPSPRTSIPCSDRCPSSTTTSSPPA